MQVAHRRARVDHRAKMRAVARVSIPVPTCAPLRPCYMPPRVVSGISVTLVARRRSAHFLSPCMAVPVGLPVSQVAHSCMEVRDGLPVSQVAPRLGSHVLRRRMLYYLAARVVVYQLLRSLYLIFRDSHPRRTSSYPCRADVSVLYQQSGHTTSCAEYDRPRHT